MKSPINSFQSIYILWGVLFFACLPLYATQNVIDQLKFKQLTTTNNLPTDEVQKVYQDQDGFMWFATRSGLCHYDGYNITTYKSNLYTPGLFTNNSVTCITDDDNHNLWIGTSDGVNILNVKYNKIRKVKTPLLPNNVISCLLKTKDNSVWIGTDRGLCRYDAKVDSFIVYDEAKTNGILRSFSIKSLCEDSDGDLWIGTWSNGLFRYIPSTEEIYTYPRFNNRNSAHVIFEDSYKNIWVGSWRNGIYKLVNPKDLERVSFVNYCHSIQDESSISDNIVYAISEDTNANTLWVGTRSGLSIMDYNTPGVFINYKSQNERHHINCDEINSILCDAAGNMWIGSIGGGVLTTDTKQPLFTQHQVTLSDEEIPITAARSLLVDNDNNLWVGIGTYGLACQKAGAHDFVLSNKLPEFAGLSLPSVYSILQRKTSGDIWFGTYTGGIYVYRKGEKVNILNRQNTSFLNSDIISSLYEDSNNNCLVGTREGLCISYANGNYHTLSEFPLADTILTSCYVRDMVEDSDGSLWLATSNNGVIHIQGDLFQPESLSFVNYGYSNGMLKTNAAISVHLDKMNRLWVGTDGGGLYLYNRGSDQFDEKSIEYNIPGDMVGSIQEDSRGNLWLGTNAGLVRLAVTADGKQPNIRVYTSADGLLDNFFIAQSAHQWGDKMLFGSYKGFNSFSPLNMEEQYKETPFAITDIKIFNQSLNGLDKELRNRISPLSPAYTQRIQIPYGYNNFSIEFASLTYKNPELNRYAYQLDGFDKEWQYTDASRRFAYYNNLKTGIYKFRLKATAENGVWSGYIRELTIEVLPPFWATWWAYVIYALVLCTILYFIYRSMKNRILLRNELRMREVEKAKLEELNHAKLQFFTNITHELLTPLTIISATVDELKMQAPTYTELYTVMGSNISRLIRLLQQILEFRKAESGNLRLSVSNGDIAEFVRKEAECFIPLIKKTKMNLSVTCAPQSIYGYFDTDKLDKILYNLISNAAKYNKEGRDIDVSIAQSGNPDFVEIRIKDNGEGISKEKQKGLFKRFYEGDYRKFNTIGTGIGLSLTKDLVELHQGTIQVDSELGKGTEFVITIPVARSYYKEEQIEETIQMPISDVVVFEEMVSETDESVQTDNAKQGTLLLVEDNEELLHLMVRLLSRDFTLVTAQNGKEAVEALETNEIDLIVSDVMMPVMDGIELCKYVKSKLEISHIPIILLTAKNKEEDRAEAYEVGADAFIGKPFNLSVLHARIRNLLRYKERMAKDFKNQLVFEAKELNYTSIDEEFLQRAIDCVNRHIDNCEFDQPQFIEEMGTSKSTLYKKLKSLTGLNTSAFIRNIRLKAACQLMENKGSSVRVSELAYTVGFNDPKYFSLCFKKEFGMLPTEYMERFVGTDSTHQ